MKFKKWNELNYYQQILVLGLLGLLLFFIGYLIGYGNAQNSAINFCQQQIQQQINEIMTPKW